MAAIQFFLCVYISSFLFVVDVLGLVRQRGTGMVRVEVEEERVLNADEIMGCGGTATAYFR